MRSTGWALLVVIVSALAAAPRAEACSPPRCQGGDLVPATRTGTTPHVPANLTGLVWTPYAHFARSGDPMIDTASVALVASDGHRVALRSESAGPSDFGPRTLLLAVPLREGQTYDFEQISFCAGSGAPTAPPALVVGPAAPLPTSLGTLAITLESRGDVTVAAGASCVREVPAHAIQVALEPSADAAPWRDALVYSTLVDGQPWRPSRESGIATAYGGSWVGRERDLVFTFCTARPPDDVGSNSRGVTPGVHTVQLRATLPGTEIVLETPPLSITLSCGDGEVDGGSDTDGGSDNDGGPTAPAANDGCACLRPTSSLPLTAFLAAAVVLSLRRRRR